jgi:hypothetical protein
MVLGSLLFKASFADEAAFDANVDALYHEIVRINSV